VNDKPLASLDTANAMLAQLTASLAEAVSLPELDKIQKSADTLHHMMRLARFGLAEQNRAFNIRARALRGMGGILAAILPHRGGRPPETLRAEEGLPTLAELGFSYNFSSECQQIFHIPQVDFDAYLALGEVADDQTDTDQQDQPQYARPLELTKKGLFNYVAWGGSQRKASQQRWEEREAENRRAKAVKDAEAAATATTDEPAEPEPEPLPPPDIPPPPKPAAKPERIRAAIRTMIDPTGNPHEIENARAYVHKHDPRGETLDQTKDQELFAAMHHSNEYLRDRMNEYYQQASDAPKLREQIRKLEARDRERLAVIRELQAENERLKAENERLKAENERLKAENDVLKQVSPSRHREASTVH
jgi:hypothetical protein